MIKNYAFLIAVVVILGAGPVFAQSLTAPAPDTTASQSSAPEISESIEHTASLAPSPAPSPVTTAKQPLEITADKTLEWKRNDQLLIATGNAFAKQGDSSIAAPVLTAHYNEKTAGGGMKISDVKADGGGVIIKSKDSSAYGDKADYDLDKGYADMTGDNLRLVTKDQVVTARDKFEYFVQAGRMTAIGQAKAVRGEDTLEADKISAVMKDDADGKRVLDTLEAEGHVVITTPTEKVTGAYGIYHSSTNKAEMKGGVKITRGPNVVEGDRGEVDMNTNTSRIFAGDATPSGGGRVKGVFYPNNVTPPASPSATAPAPGPVTLIPPTTQPAGKSDKRGHLP